MTTSELFIPKSTCQNHEVQLFGDIITAKFPSFDGVSLASASKAAEAKTTENLPHLVLTDGHCELIISDRNYLQSPIGAMQAAREDFDCDFVKDRDRPGHDRPESAQVEYDCFGARVTGDEGFRVFLQIGGYKASLDPTRKDTFESVHKILLQRRLVRNLEEVRIALKIIERDNNGQTKPAEIVNNIKGALRK